MNHQSTLTGMVQATKNIFRDEGLPIGCFACAENHVICIMMIFTLVLIKGWNSILVNCSNLIENVRILQSVL